MIKTLAVLIIHLLEPDQVSTIMLETIHLSAPIQATITPRVSTIPLSEKPPDIETPPRMTMYLLVKMQAITTLPMTIPL